MLRRHTLLAVVLLVALVATVALPPAVRAAAPTITEEEAIATLQEYFIVRGDPQGNLHLDAPITRAEAAAIFVRAMGTADLAPSLADKVPFPDARGHWGAGEIALAERQGLMRGDPSGLFRPDDQITYAEILTVLLRMVGREPQGDWDPNAIMAAADELNLIPEGIVPTQPAIRRNAFWALAAALTTVPVGSYPSLASRTLDWEPPLLTLDPVDAITSADSVTLRGTTVGAARVMVNGVPVDFDRVAQSFSHTASLSPGVNNLLVEAIDAVGNRAAQQLTIERRGNIARISITGPKQIVAGTATPLQVEARDKSGNLLPLDQIEVELTGDVATFDLATLSLIAGDKEGKGTLTLRSGSVKQSFAFTVVAPSEKAHHLVIAPVNKGVPIALNQKYTVTVQVVDQSGKVVSDDYGRTITLASSGPQVSITPVAPVTEKGVATFEVVGQSIGPTTLTAATPYLGQAVYPLEVLTARRIMLIPNKQSLPPDGSSSVKIKAQLQDETGRRVNNDTGRDILVYLTLTDTGRTETRLENPYLTIPAGKGDSAGDGAMLTAGILPGVVAVRGELVSDHDYAIQSLQFPVTTPLAGSRLELTASPANPTPGDEITLRLRVVDGSGKVVRDGSYAFQLKVDTSNNEPLFRGLPEGVALSFTGSPYYPVDDGRAPNHPENDPYSVIGRTVDGEAEFSLSYGRSGIVKVQAVPMSVTHEAYHPETGFGPASPSTGLLAIPLEIAFQGSPMNLELVVDSPVGKDLSAGATSPNSTVTVRARVVDGGGNVVPGYSQVITLVRLDGGDKATSIVGLHQRKAQNGVAVFTLQAHDEAGLDYYEASAGSLVSNPVSVAVRDRVADPPVVVAIRGLHQGDEAPTAGFVGPDATHMQVQLAPQVADPREAEYWVLAKVYREKSSTPIYEQSVNLSDPVPVIEVPRGYLKTGTERYRVTIHNGYGTSAFSSTLDDVTQATVATYGSYQLKGATFDAPTGELRLTTSGLSSTGRIDLGRIAIRKGGDWLVLGSDPGAEVKSVSSSRVVIKLDELADELTPGDDLPYLEAEAGWYVDKSGTSVARAADSIAITPMARIEGGSLDIASRRLYLSGSGLTQGSIDWDLVQIWGSGAAEPVSLQERYDKQTRLTDTEAILTLSKGTFEAIMNLAGDRLYVTASEGWIRVGSGSTAARGAALTGEEREILLRLVATGARYDAAADTLILESSAGFEGLTLDPSRLLFTTGPGSGQIQWSPAETPAVACGEGSTLLIPLSPADAAELEELFGGRNVYMNTEPGWLTDAQGRAVAPTPDYSLLFRVEAW